MKYVCVFVACNFRHLLLGSYFFNHNDFLFTVQGPRFLYIKHMQMHMIMDERWEE